MEGTLAYYNENAKAFCDATRDADMGAERERFLGLLRGRAYILDAGCGSGRDAKAFLEAGCRVAAMDASPGICEEAEKFLGQRVLCRPFGEMDFVREFDGIWACASLLHVPRKEIASVMRRLWLALKEKGILYASFKYGEGERWAEGRFFNDYRKEDLRELLEKGGFEIREIYLSQDVRRGRESERWINALARKRETASGQESMA